MNISKATIDTAARYLQKHGKQPAQLEFEREQERLAANRTNNKIAMALTRKAAKERLEASQKPVDKPTE